MTAWTPSSWRAFPAQQQPDYPLPDALEAVLRRVQTLPPLVDVGETENLKAQLAEAADGKRFVIHGGDCAERFEECNGTAILQKLKILMQMSLILTYSGRRPVVRIGRMAGQYGKPRSSGTEQVGDLQLPVYRGDNVNDPAPTLAARQPDPTRLERGYFHAAATLNYVRALVEGGFASLRHPENWDLDMTSVSERAASYRGIASRIRDALDYFDCLGIHSAITDKVDLFTSHEALLLPYEQAMTRPGTTPDRMYNVGAHFLWLGERTRDLKGAHVEYLRGLANPLGIKVGPKCSPKELVELIRVLNPTAERGKITLITRSGADRVRAVLQPIIHAVTKAKLPVLWSCDPMHGNTEVTKAGLKTRRFDTILEELEAAFDLHAQAGTSLSGFHFELTGDAVTECVGGLEQIDEERLQQNYTTACDPRLNARQSIEAAFRIGALLDRYGASTRRSTPRDVSV